MYRHPLREFKRVRLINFSIFLLKFGVGSVILGALQILSRLEMTKVIYKNFPESSNTL